jgi:hypothetical protein
MRTLASGTWSVCATPERAAYGTCVEDQIVTSSPRQCATTARGSIGTPCDASDSYRLFTTTSALAIAASASPFTIVWYAIVLPSPTMFSSREYDAQSGWTSGAPGSMAATKSCTTGSGSYSTSISAAASSAIFWVRAATPATISPSNRTRSWAKSVRSWTSPPNRTSGRSSCVTTATTPGRAFALEVSIRRIRACGWSA